MVKWRRINILIFYYIQAAAALKHISDIPNTFYKTSGLFWFACLAICASGPCVDFRPCFPIDNNKTPRNCEGLKANKTNQPNRKYNTIICA